MLEDPEVKERKKNSGVALGFANVALGDFCFYLAPNYKCHSGCLYKVFKYQSCNSSLPVPANDHLITFN
jgi:hypothetical protein